MWLCTRAHQRQLSCVNHNISVWRQMFMLGWQEIFCDPPPKKKIYIYIYYKIKQSENTSSSRLSTSLVFPPCLSLPSTLDGKIIINNHDTLSFLDFEMKAESEAHARRMRMCLDRELVGPSSIRPQSLHSDQPPLPSDRAPSPGKISQGVIFFLHIFESISPSK